MSFVCVCACARARVLDISGFFLNFRGLTSGYDINLCIIFCLVSWAGRKEDRHERRIRDG